MPNLRRISIALALAFMAVALSGCFNRRLLRFGTHSTKPVVLLETIDTSDYWLWSDDEHVFWSCAENDSTLSCTRRCGGDTDLVCPQITMFSNAVGTNTR